MSPNPKETIADVASRVLAGTGTPEDVATVARWAKRTPEWIMQQRASGIRAAEERGE